MFFLVAIKHFPNKKTRFLLHYLQSELHSVTIFILGPCPLPNNASLRLLFIGLQYENLNTEVPTYSRLNIHWHV